MFSRRLKTGYFTLEGLNSFATVYYFYYLYFFMQKAYGFGNQANLMLAALNGGTYALMAWFAGNFAQRYGYFPALKAGYSIMILALSLGLAARSSAGQVGVMVLTVVGMSFTWPTLEALISEGEPRTGLRHMVGLYNLIWAATAALSNFSGGAMLQKFGFSSLFYVPMTLQGIQLALTLWLEAKATKPMNTTSTDTDNREPGEAAAVPPAMSSKPLLAESRLMIAAVPTGDGYGALELKNGQAVKASGSDRTIERGAVQSRDLREANGIQRNERRTNASKPWPESVDDRQSGADSPESQAALAEPSPPRGKRFLRMAWLANPFAYIAINTLIAVVPGVARRLELSTMAAGFCCSTWCFARFGAFAVLWRWTGWHYSFRWLLLAYLGLAVSFGAVLLGHNVAVVVAAQLVFGAAAGLIYYSSLFYSMDLGDTKGEHGGIHEAVIGLGNCAGPAVGAAALQLAPQYSQSGTFAVLILLLCGLAGLIGIWRSKSQLVNQ